MANFFRGGFPQEGNINWLKKYRKAEYVQRRVQKEESNRFTNRAGKMAITHRKGTYRARMPFSKTLLQF